MMADETSDKIALPSVREAEVGVLAPADLLEQQRLSGLRDAFVSTIERLEQTIDLETAALRQPRPVDLRAFNHRKSHGLLEMTRAVRALDQLSSDHASLSSLERLRVKLGKNLAILESHLRAVKHVSGLIARAIEEDESDGTYSAIGYKPMPKS
jgi:hypothetical protein